MTRTICPEGGACYSEQVVGCSGTEAAAILVATAQAADQADSDTDDSGFAVLLPTALARLAQIQNQASAIQTPAAALSTITLPGTAAAALPTIQAALRQIGNGTGLLAEAHRDEARILLYIGRILRRVRGLVTPTPTPGP